MPIYEYEHDGDHDGSCQQRFEELQGMSELPLERCPECGTELIERCDSCQGLRHSLMPHCMHCGTEKDNTAIEA